MTANNTNEIADETEQYMPEMTMASLPETLREACSRAGWADLMPVQIKAIPYLLDRRDVLVQSRTGSGKTGAFILPMLERINPKQKHCQALVLVPTRELAKQVAKEAELLAGDSGVRTIAVYGGTSYGPQIDAFRKGAHLVVGTPGRVLDHLLKRNLSLSKLKILVFDEADRMLSMGFYPDMREVRSYLPHHEINVSMFSATFPTRVIHLANEFMQQPTHLSLSSDQVHVAETEHVFYLVPGMGKDRSLVRILEVENPDSAIIFCNTKAKVNYVSIVLRRFGYDAAEISSDLSQNAREKVLTRVRKGKLRFLVATDVASRGIDIPELSHAILFEPPEDSEDYIHRAGRTGRAGAAGTAISLVDRLEASKLKRIGTRYDIDLQERELPSDEDVAVIVAERATVLLEARLRERDKLKIERMQRFIPQVRRLSENDDGLALLAMLLDDFYQDALHAPAIPPAPATPRKSDSGVRSGGRRRKPKRRSERRKQN